MAGRGIRCIRIVQQIIMCLSQFQAYHALKDSLGPYRRCINTVCASIAFVSCEINCLSVRHSSARRKKSQKKVMSKIVFAVFAICLAQVTRSLRQSVWWIFYEINIRFLPVRRSSLRDAFVRHRPQPKMEWLRYGTRPTKHLQLWTRHSCVLWARQAMRN